MLPFAYGSAEVTRILRGVYAVAMR
jgi:hypothetical protein